MVVRRRPVRLAVVAGRRCRSAVAGSRSPRGPGPRTRRHGGAGGHSGPRATRSRDVARIGARRGAAARMGPPQPCRDRREEVGVRERARRGGGDARAEAGIRNAAGTRAPPVPAGARPPMEPIRSDLRRGPFARRVPRPIDVRSPFRGGADGGAQADELPRGRRGLARRTGIRRARPGPRRGDRAPCGPPVGVGGSDRADRPADPPCRAPGVDVDVHRPIHRTDRQHPAALWLSPSEAILG